MTRFRFFLLLAIFFALDGSAPVRAAEDAPSEPLAAVAKDGPTAQEEVAERDEAQQLVAEGQRLTQKMAAPATHATGA